MYHFQPAICYSGYREGQSPRKQMYPTDQDVLEDLKHLQTFVKHIRMYDTSFHVKQVCKLIVKHDIDLKIMLGVEPKGELDNPNCHFGGRYSKEEIEHNKRTNYQQLDEMIELATTYKDIVFAVSVGNENTSDWHPNLMPEQALIDHVNYVRQNIEFPITFCEGQYFWLHNKKLGEVVDFISIHSYPQWQSLSLHEAIKITKQDIKEAKETFFNKPVIMTEFGWATQANHQMIISEATEDNQAIYLDAVYQHLKEENMLAYLFEAYDETWKGSNNPEEQEKHWGVFKEDRTPKKWQKENPFYELSNLNND
jgi:exo-beta-1,3-glucanase (GH17 family)